MMVLLMADDLVSVNNRACLRCCCDADGTTLDFHWMLAMVQDSWVTDLKNHWSSQANLKQVKSEHAKAVL